MNASKVFGIGFHKTGTKSLAKALEILGYSVTRPNGGQDPNLEDNALHIVRELIDRYDAFQDFPWAALYRELDRLRPDSKFILTVRPAEEWIESAIRYFGETTSPIRRWIYGAHAGSPIGHERHYIERYERHNAEVLEYFSSRPDCLLVLRITDGEGWSPLCKFLDREIPSREFPSVAPVSKRQ